jgi:hypothetical protein
MYLTRNPKPETLNPELGQERQYIFTSLLRPSMHSLTLLSPAAFTVLLSRSEPDCAQRLTAPVEHSEIVTVALPADAGTEKKFLAFPPDGEFELWLLTESKEEKGLHVMAAGPEQAAPAMPTEAAGNGNPVTVQ